ncbi:MAG: hypothetical protein KDE14_04550 [Rhodobacteraceae bacterium]|nr:hypothetical protein [Paracoccaceae bacterium]
MSQKSNRTFFVRTVLSCATVMAMAMTATMTAVIGAARAQNTLPLEKPLSAERLMMPLFPNGWIEASSTRGNIEMIDYVPQDQSAGVWRDRITLEVYHDLNSLPLDVLYGRIQAVMRAQCDGVIAGRFQSGVNNGYPSAFWTFGCKRNLGSGMGETRYSKAIQGETRVYVLTRAWQTPVYGDQGPDIPQRDIEDAVAFLTTAVVCADGDPNHACPQPR